MSIETGAIIDNFRLIERIHQGSMSALWTVERVASDSGPDVPLVMKIPLFRYGDDPAAIVGFEVEQMILPRLEGEHVPHFIASGDFTEQPYIVMERIQGPSLRPILDAAPLPIDEVARLGALVADAVHDLHHQHVIHLDLKPSNILFRPAGDGRGEVAVLVDFGLSRHDFLPDLLAEEFHLPMGTGPYISPEQVLHVRNEPRSDLFAFGVMLYHLATGARPFGKPDTVRGLRKRLYQDPVPPRALRADLPPWLQEIILHCLEVDAADRYSTAAQVAFELRHPEQVNLTARSKRMRRDGVRQRMRRWFRAHGVEPARRPEVAQHLRQAPIIVVAVDTVHGSEALAEALRVMTARTLHWGGDARLACVTVQKIARIGMDINVDAEGRNLHVQGLVALKHWARPLDLPPERISFHTLEAPDVAAALVDYASTNQVDHILIGARASSAMRRYLGSVSAQVVAEAPCTVTVVREPRE